MSPSVSRLVDLFAREIESLIERQAQELAKAARAAALRSFPEKPAAPTKRRSNRGPAAPERRRRRRRQRRDPRPAATVVTPTVVPHAGTPVDRPGAGPPVDLRERGGNPAAGPGLDPGEVEAPGAVVEDLQEPAADPAPAPAHDEDGTRPEGASIEDEKEEVLAPRRQMTCRVCGELGHNARRHRGDLIPLQPTATAAPAPSPPPVDLIPIERLATAPRGHTMKVPNNRLTRDERAAGAEVVYPDDILRPLTRGDCLADAVRPCPWVSCKFHLYLDVNRHTGAIKLNFPHLEVWELAHSCALDLADRGGITLEETGAAVNLTRERVRQIEASAAERAQRMRRRGELEFEEPPEQGFSPLGAVIAG